MDDWVMLEMDRDQGELALMALCAYRREIISRKDKHPFDSKMHDYYFAQQSDLNEMIQSLEEKLGYGKTA